MAQSSIKIFRGQHTRNAYVWSPFVTKLEARFRFANVPYKVETGSPKTAPRGKLPYIELAGTNGTTQMGDSALISRYLVENGMAADLNASLGPAQRATDSAFRALLEEKFYFYMGREKWFDNYTTMRDEVMAPIPYPIRLVVGWLARRANIATMWGQGTGRYSNEEIRMFEEEVVEDVASLLTEAKSKNTRKNPEDPFWVLGGEEPTEADTTLFGSLVGALVCTA